MVLASSGTRPDLAGLWIDYLLLPERLDEHLAALATGAASSPSHSELLNMLLEQAVSNYKHGKKEAEAPFKASSGKTASVLCERAVRVALAAELTLEDIEVKVARQVQALLLKALVKYDKSRSLVHECNYHRWVIRKSLAPGTGALGGQGVRAAAAAAAAGDETLDILQDSVSVVESVESQEEASISFLEAALEKLPTEQQSKQNGDGKKQATVVNGLMHWNSDYLCQLMFDLAEAHFMRSRLKRASELFIRCGQLVPGLDNPSAVPKDRLNGFVAACRAFDSSQAIQDAKNSAGQEALVACEKGRHSLKRKQHPVSYEHCNGEARKPGNKFGMQNGVGQEHRKPLLNGLETKPPKLERCDSVSEGNIVEVVAGDLLKCRLSWGYCQSLARDLALPLAVRCKISVCNALRHILEGGAFETICGVIESCEEKEVAEFLFQLMRRIVEGGQADGEQVLLLRQLCMYTCCMFEEPWCWELAMQQGLLSRDDVLQLKPQTDKGLEVVGVTTSGGADTRSLLDVLQGNSFSSFENVLSATGRRRRESIARVLWARSLDAIESGDADKLARDFLGLAGQLSPKDVDTQLLLWFLDRQGQGNSSLPDKSEKDVTPGMLEYVAVKLIDTGDWTSLKELLHFHGHNERKQQSLLLEVTGMLSQLLQLCVEFEETMARRDNLSEKISGLEAGLWQAFEDFMSLVFSMTEQRQLLQLGFSSFPLLSRISSVRVLERLASLAAGWLNRCSDDAVLLELPRYGALAELTSITGPRHTYKKAAVESGKGLFNLLVKRLLVLIKSAQGDNTNCSKWLLSLADLAFMDQSYLKSLQLYLQAGALRSSFFCDRLSSMARDLFTPWVLSRMITSCQEIGARLQAIVLCQCLPEPDYELVFKILQENPMIVDRDADSYFECIWEIPILELLVNMHSKAGDRRRVNALISLLQQPALNVHNPASVRQAHVLGMEQRFLQRFYAELLG